MFISKSFTLSILFFLFFAVYNWLVDWLENFNKVFAINVNFGHSLLVTVIEPNDIHSGQSINQLLLKEKPSIKSITIKKIWLKFSSFILYDWSNYPSIHLQKHTEPDQFILMLNMQTFAAAALNSNVISI